MDSTSTHWAIVKYEEEPYCGAVTYHFKHYVGESWADVARRVAGDFEAVVDENIAMLPTPEEREDEELCEERAGLRAHLSKYLQALRNPATIASGKEMGSSIDVGLMTYQFSVIIEGGQEDFVARFLDALDGDKDFVSDGESLEEILAMRGQPAADRSPDEVGTLLELIGDEIRNDYT